jgi:hypothetical protein
MYHWHFWKPDTSSNSWQKAPSIVRCCWKFWPLCQSPSHIPLTEGSKYTTLHKRLHIWLFADDASLFLNENLNTCVSSDCWLRWKYENNWGKLSWEQGNYPRSIGRGQCWCFSIGWFEGPPVGGFVEATDLWSHFSPWRC